MGKLMLACLSLKKVFWYTQSNAYCFDHHAPILESTIAKYKKMCKCVLSSQNSHLYASMSHYLITQKKLILNALGNKGKEVLQFFIVRKMNCVPTVTGQYIDFIITFHWYYTVHPSRLCFDHNRCPFIWMFVLLPLVTK